MSDDDDDAEELSGGTMLLNSNDVDFASTHTMGLRFNVCAPANAQVLSAMLTFTADEPDTAPTSAQIWGELVGDALGFDVQAITARTRTSASVFWPSITPWVEGDVESTPDLSAIVSEILADPAWTGCGHVVFIIEGNGDREAVAHDKRPPEAPELQFTYQP